MRRSPLPDLRAIVTNWKAGAVWLAIFVALLVAGGILLAWSGLSTASRQAADTGSGIARETAVQTLAERGLG